MDTIMIKYNEVNVPQKKKKKIILDRKIELSV